MNEPAHSKPIKQHGQKFSDALERAIAQGDAKAVTAILSSQKKAYEMAMVPLVCQAMQQPNVETRRAVVGINNNSVILQMVIHDLLTSQNTPGLIALAEVVNEKACSYLTWVTFESKNAELMNALVIVSHPTRRTRAHRVLGFFVEIIRSCRPLDASSAEVVLRHAAFAVNPIHCPKPRRPTTGDSPAKGT